MEADWKKFRKMAPLLRERYLTEQNARIISLFTDPKKTETERFWDAEEVVRDVAKALCRCLDGHSRSKMTHFMRLMFNVGMLKREDLVNFSPKVRLQVLGEYEDGSNWQSTTGN